MDKWNNYEEWEIDEPMWKKAINFANKYHTEAGQYRIGKDGKKIPYITHIYEVMKILINEANISSDKMLTVAALHDTIEDTSCTFKDIEENFGKEIAEAVQILSKGDNQPFDEYSKNIFTCKKYPWLGTIKLADRIHNMRTYPETNDYGRIKYKYDETLRCITPYAENQSPILAEKLDETMSMIKNFLNSKELNFKGKDDGK